MNPIAFDFTLIAQVISFLIILLLFAGIIYIFAFVRRKQKQDKEIMEKLNRIVELLENDKTNL